MQVTLVLLLTTLLAASVSAVPIDSSCDGRLHIIRVGDNSLEAIFYNADAGIRIRANSLSLSLSSMNGEELLLSGDKPHGSSLFATIMGHSFLEYNTTLEDGTKKIVDYAVPESLAEQTKEAVESAKVERMLSQLEDNDTRTATESAFLELFQRPEIALIESAAIALAQAGVMGFENQGALNFYMVAKALVKTRNREEVASVIQQDQDVGSRRQKRCTALMRASRVFLLANAPSWLASIPLSNAISLFYSPRYCHNNRRTCRRCPRYQDCLGMCGPGCDDCWWWACGSCCYHGGCYDHDVCCRDWCRFSCQVPIGFNCLSFHCF